MAGWLLNSSSIDSLVMREYGEADVINFRHMAARILDDDCGLIVPLAWVKLKFWDGMPHANYSMAGFQGLGARPLSVSTAD